MHKYLQSVAISIIQSVDEPLKPLRYLRNDCVGSVCNCVTTRNMSDPLHCNPGKTLFGFLLPWALSETPFLILWQICRMIATGR